MKVGDLIRYSVAHGQSVDCWGLINRYGGTSNGMAEYHGHIVAGVSPGHWHIGSPCHVYDPPEKSKAWVDGPRWVVVPEDEVPDEIWAEIAKNALLG